MKTSVEYLEPTRVKLTAEVSGEEFQAAYDAAVKKIASQVNIPGFRRGKAPRRVLEANVGREYIVETAVNDSLDVHYRASLKENAITPLGSPSVEVTEVPMINDGKQLSMTFELDCAPRIAFPKLSDVVVEVEPAVVADDAVDARLDDLRSRFATLKVVDRPVADKDFLTLDLVAVIDGEEVDSLTGVSYQVGSGTMLEGIDAAVTGKKSGESVTFTTTLEGGEHEGEQADVTVTIDAVKESELPAADDDFAQEASEFDTIDELLADLRTKAEEEATRFQVFTAQQKLLETLADGLDVPLPEGWVNEVLAQAGEEAKKDDVEADLRRDVIVQELGKAFNVEVSQEELINVLVQQAQMSGIDPNMYIQYVAQSNGIDQMAHQLAIEKTLISTLRYVTVRDTNGVAVDVIKVVGEAPEGETEPAFDGALGEKKPAAKKAPAKKAPAKKAAAKKDEAEGEAEAEEKPAKKAPAKKAPAKKTAAKKDDAEAEEKPAAKKAPAKKAPAKKTAAKKADAE